MNTFKRVEVSSKYHSLRKVVYDILFNDNQLVIETDNYTLNVHFDSIDELKKRDSDGIDIIVNASSVLSNIYFTKMETSDCDLLFSTFKSYKK